MNLGGVRRYLNLLRKTPDDVGSGSNTASPTK
jgi:hypothetical protein